MNVIGIETSCDETAVAVVADGKYLLSNSIASQSDLHAAHGGIVPELASRQHIRHISRIASQAVDDAGLGWKDIDAVAVTHGPGLAGALIVGVNTAKGIAASLGIPLLGVNHLEGHVYAAWLDKAMVQLTPPEVQFPLMCLITSGGHTDLIVMAGHGQFNLIGQTRDDAAGEAFDKVARVLGLGFPGGPEVQRVARPGNRAGHLPRAWLRGTEDFSFSGLKTATLNKAKSLGLYPSPEGGADPGLVAELAASFQDSVVDVLVTKTVSAAKRYGCRGILLGGGVAANALLRQEIEVQSPLPSVIPPAPLCTDNGAMIAACAWYSLTSGKRSSLDLDILPSLRLGVKLD